MKQCKWRSSALTFVLAGLLQTVSGADDYSFRTQILPVLTKAGCNTGGCHGAATGQGGFKLSLLGYDPEEDHLRITRELSGRRIDLDSPAQSLFLRKPSRQLEHEGGRKLPRDAGDYKLVLDWIAAGAPYGPRDLFVAGLTVTPPDLLVKSAGQTAQLRVTALLSNGTKEDVTRLALFTSNDDAVAEVSKTGEVTTRGSGATSVMVRYSGQVAAARLAIPYANPEIVEKDFTIHNFIDSHVSAEWKRLRLPASDLSTDAEFLRRVCLDVAGRLPSLAEARAFLSDSDPGKRARLIDQLLDSPEFDDFWTLRLADLLLLGGKQGSPESTAAYYKWLHEEVRQDRGLDQMARALLTATGNYSENGPANFFSLSGDPRDLAEQTGRIFLGTRIACARCHAHPADRWTQDDYHRFAAYFARVTTDGGVVKASLRGEVEHPKTGRALAPKPLGAAASSAAEPGVDRRLELAEWLASSANELFAQNFVNRIWKHLLGRGLVEPVDDLRPTNPPTNPPLLHALARDFAAGQFRLRRLVRTIVSSRTYQLTSRATAGNRADDRFYSHAYLKDLPAQVFADAIAQVTGVFDRYEGYPEGTRAVQVMGSRTPSYALDILGRCAREKPCESAARNGGGLSQALHLINGSTVNSKLDGPAVQHLMNANLPVDEMIVEVYLRAFSRPPGPDELSEWKRLLSEASDKKAALQDLLWGLLNSRKFAFNH